MKSCLLICFILLLEVCFAQKKEEKLKEHKETWYEGSVMLTSGEELTGLLWYNDSNGVLSFQDGTSSKAFTPRSVAGFEFYDEELQKQRIYYTFEYNDNDATAKAPRRFFFELIKEFKDFAVLTRTDPITVKERSSSANPASHPGQPAPTGFIADNYLEISQTETIFIMDSKGSIKPFIQVVKFEFTKDWDWGLDDKKKNKMIDEDLFARYIGIPAYEKLQAYAKENKLKFRRKDDFLKILDYYASHLHGK